MANDNHKARARHYAADSLKARRLPSATTAQRRAKASGRGRAHVAKQKGMKVVAREFTNDKATDFNAILTKVRATKPDVVMYGGMDATAGPMAKQMTQLGVKSTLLAGDGVCSPEFIKLAGDASGILHCSQAGEAVESSPRAQTSSTSTRSVSTPKFRCTRHTRTTRCT